ncbi:Proton myo-inositol cotransporter, partial [Frankliniella fusca]
LSRPFAGPQLVRGAWQCCCPRPRAMTVVSADAALRSPAGAARPGCAGGVSAVNVALTVLGATAGLLFGYDTGVVSGAMLFIREEMNLENAWHEYIVSGTVLAAWVFSFVGGYSVDRFGRRSTILVAAVVFTAGSLGMSLAPSKELLLAGRVVVGVGVGLASMSTPVYLAETSAPAVRGQVVTTFNVGVTFGQFAASVICGLFTSVRPGGWRWMLGLAGVPSLALLAGALLLPESPRWLVMRGRALEAEHVLRLLRAARGPGDEAGVQRELREIQESSLQGQAGAGAGAGAHAGAEAGAVAGAGAKAPPGEVVHSGGKDRACGTVLRVLRTPSARRPLLIASMLTAIQQLVGVNTVMYYSASIIQMAGVGDSSSAIWLSVVVALANFLFATAGVFLIERFGRRPLLLVSLLGVVAALCMLAAGFLVMDLTSPKVMRVLHADDPCASVSRCAGCVSSSLGCGYCFASSGDEPSWCGNTSMSGQCTAEPARMTWALGWCPSPYSWIAIASLVLFLVMFSPGLGPVPWTINSEIHPMWARGVSGSVATSCHWGFNLLVSLTFLSLVEALTAKGVFLLYAVLGAVGAVLIWAVLPETRGVRLEDMDGLFKSRCEQCAAPAAPTTRAPPGPPGPHSTTCSSPWGSQRRDVELT